MLYRIDYKKEDRVREIENERERVNERERESYQRPKRKGNLCHRNMCAEAEVRMVVRS